MNRTAGKWIMEQTGIRALNLKFHFDEKHAWAGIEIDTRNLDKRIELFDKLEKLNAILTKAVPFELKWELEATINMTKTVSRVYTSKNEVNIYNKNCWKETNHFFYETMYPIEEIFIEYTDFLKY